MRWVNSVTAWEAKALMLEAAQSALEAGRLCMEVHCLRRSVVAFDVRGQDGDEWTAGFCGQHAVELPIEQPDSVVGQPRILAPGEALLGPRGERA